jgi:hypothetical protein
MHKNTRCRFKIKETKILYSYYEIGLKYCSIKHFNTVGNIERINRSFWANLRKLARPGNEMV